MSEPSAINRPYLPAIGILESLSEDDRAMLCSYGGFSFYEPGHTVIQQGDPQDSLYVILSGQLHARRTHQGREIFLGSVKNGESLGDINIFDPAKASATVVAMAPTQVWKIDRASLEEFQLAYPEASAQIYRSICGLLSRRVRLLANRIEEKVELQSLLEEIGVQ
jgi:CRP/FNR family cyclic AMP-dependent transcriptional regulator